MLATCAIERGDPSLIHVDTTRVRTHVSAVGIWGIRVGFSTKLHILVDITTGC